MSRPTRRSLLIGAAGLAACGAEGGRRSRPEPTADLDSGELPVDSGTPSTTPTGDPTWLETADTAMPHTAPGRTRPNVLLVFPDQLRAMALSALGERNIRTPVFDALWAESAGFRQAVTPGPVCTPARAALWTGWYPYATGTSENDSFLPQDAPTLAKELRALGYTTGYVGKWHLAGGRQEGLIPPDHRGGFVDWFAGHNMGHNYIGAQYWTDGTEVAQRPDPPGTWEPTWQTTLALDYLEERAREPDQPWFLVVSWGPPHPNGNWPVDWTTDVPPDLFERVDGEALTFRENVPEWIKVPNRTPALGYSDPHGARRFLKGYYACILGLEAELQRLLDRLAALSMREDTIVLFASDHGEMAGSHGRYKKGNWHEESVRIPLSFRWPGMIAPRELDTPATLVDVLPTLRVMCGGDPWSIGHGRDLSGLLLEGTEPAGDWTGSYIARKESGPNQRRALRTPRWKYGEALGFPALNALFDLEADPWEQVNLFDDPDLGDVQAELAAELLARRVATGDPSL
ncbi:MAG: arylsulfatase A-like enzyme [Myxococcota bacterium]|jgi:arylsulfatase A-like enzyme